MNSTNERISYILKAVIDNQTGELGLMFADTPIIQYPMVANEGLLIAHDLLEHVNGLDKIGSIDDELEALAGVWYIRGQMNELRRDGVGSAFSPSENIAHDVARMAQIYVENKVDFKNPIPEIEDDSWELEIDEILAIAYCIINEEYENDLDGARLDEYINAVRPFMANGFQKIERRFPDFVKANELFWEIADKVQPYCIYPEFEGAEFELIVDYKNNFVSCSQCFEDEF